MNLIKIIKTKKHIQDNDLVNINGQVFKVNLIKIDDPTKKNFKVGDRVLITKPVNIREAPGWATYMNIYNNQIEVVGSIGIYIQFKNNIFAFNKNWLTKID